MNYNLDLVDPELRDLDDHTLLLLNTQQTKHNADSLKEIKTDFKDHIVDFKVLNNVVGGLDCHPKMNPGGSTAECSQSDSVRKKRIVVDLLMLTTHWLKRHPRTSGIGTLLGLGIAVWLQAGTPGL